MDILDLLTKNNSNSFSTKITPHFVLSALIIVFACIFWFMIKRIVDKSFEVFSYGRNATRSVHVIKNILQALDVIICIVLVLQINGINVDSLLTGLGITSIIVGFALQDILKDWMMGSSIMVNDFFAVGEVVRIGDFVGEVEKMNFKCTRLIDLSTGNLVTISNREILTVEILSDYIDLRLPFSYECTVQERKDFMTKVMVRLSEMETLNSCEDLGVQDFGESSITELVRLHAKEIQNYYQIRRDALTMIRSIYEEEHMTIPYNKLDVAITK